jgi:hypothetical protein
MSYVNQPRKKQQRETAKFSRKMGKILVKVLLNLSSPPKTEMMHRWVFLR